MEAAAVPEQRRFIRVSPRRPCPICGKKKWCTLSADGKVAYCMNTPNDHPCRNGSFAHRLDKPLEIKEPPKAEREYKIHPHEWILRVEELKEKCTDARCKSLANLLGVSTDSLRQMEVGWIAEGKYAFPMRDGLLQIVGVRIRQNDGKKYCIRGSQNGLFIPRKVLPTQSTPLLICEGPTDCAAALDIGLDAIGRPSCSGGVEMLKRFLRPKARDIIIMADNDKPHIRPDGTKWYPGQDGAIILANALQGTARSVCIIKPPKHKDLRQWLQGGLTKDAILALSKGVVYVSANAL